MIGGVFKIVSDRLFSPVNALGARGGLNKLQINMLSAATGCASGIAFAAAWLPAGWALLAVHGFLDYYDGGTRRTGRRDMRDYRLLGWDTNMVSDKTGEVAVFVGMDAGGVVSPWLAGLALVTSVGVTVLGQLLQRRGLVDLERSIFDRADRVIVLLAVGALAGFTIALVIVCCMNAVLFIQRVFGFSHPVKANG